MLNGSVLLPNSVIYNKEKSFEPSNIVVNINKTIESSGVPVVLVISSGER